MTEINRIRALREELMNSDRHIVSTFENADELARRVNEAVINWEKQTGLHSQIQPPERTGTVSAIGQLPLRRGLAKQYDTLAVRTGFVSYSHKDERYRHRLAVSLVQLERDNLISIWHDRKILPGQEWRQRSIRT